MITIVSSVNPQEWTSFVNNNESASVQHTPEWKSFLESTFNYKSYHLFAKDECDNITGLLPLFHINSKLTGSRLSSSPFSSNCGPIGSSEACKVLINESINLCEKLNPNYFEIRDVVDNNKFCINNSFSKYILKLSPNIDDVWKRLDKGSVRWGVKKSNKNGVTVESTTNLEDIRNFYEINCMAKRNLGVPSHTLDFFKNFHRFFKDYFTLYMSKYNGEMIGGGIMIFYKNRVSYSYGAANPEFLKLIPYNPFIWRSIEDSISLGYKYYDFGRTSCDNIGLINFKKRWGTTEMKIFYSYYPDCPNLITNNRNNFKYKLSTKLIHNMPMPMYKMTSNLIFGHLG